MDATHETSSQLWKRPDAQDAWEDFFTRYAGPILRYARKLGLSESAAEDVLQDMMVLFLRQLPTFEHSYREGRFRSFLLTVVHRKAADVLRRAQRSAHGPSPDDRGVESEADVELQTQSIVLPEVEDEAVSVERWRESLFEEVLVRVQQDPNLQANTWDVFSTYVLQRRPAIVVARRFAMTTNAVYQIKNRLLRRVETELNETFELDRTLFQQEVQAAGTTSEGKKRGKGGEFDLDSWLAERVGRFRLESVPTLRVFGRVRFTADLLLAARMAEIRVEPRSLLWREGGSIHCLPVHDGLLLGRDHACEGVLQEPTVSRRHCVFRVFSGGVVIEDNQSANGTSVNDRPVVRSQLAEGDVIQLGAARLLYLEHGSAAGGGAPDA